MQLLSPYQIIQINATIIAGLLILLTIIEIDEPPHVDETISVENENDEKNVEETNDEFIFDTANDWVYYIGTPFAVSSLLAIFSSVRKYEQPPTNSVSIYTCSLASMMVGFVFLAAIFFVI